MAATTDREYVRVLTRRGDLTYHVRECRHAQRDGAVPVRTEEVRDALAAGRFTRVEFGGRTVALNVCMSCVPPLPRWPVVA